MATKKLADVVPMKKHLRVSVSRLDGARSEREFCEEFAAKLGQGFGVSQVSGTGRNVEILMEKTEEWSMTEFMDDLRARLAQ